MVEVGVRLAIGFGLIILGLWAFLGFIVLLVFVFRSTESALQFGWLEWFAVIPLFSLLVVFIFRSAYSIGEYFRG